MSGAVFSILAGFVGGLLFLFAPKVCAVMLALFFVMYLSWIVLPGPTLVVMMKLIEWWDTYVNRHSQK